MASHRSTNRPFTCATCQIEIAGTPTFHGGRAFCCTGCAAGGPCVCSYDENGTSGGTVRHCADIQDWFGQRQASSSATPGSARSR